MVKNLLANARRWKRRGFDPGEDPLEEGTVSSSGLSFYVPGALLGAFTLALGR